MHRPSDRDVNWKSPAQGKSPPVQVKEPYGNLDMVTCRLSSCNPECTKYTCRLYSKEGLVVYRERKKVKRDPGNLKSVGKLGLANRSQNANR